MQSMLLTHVQRLIHTEYSSFLFLPVTPFTSSYFRQQRFLPRNQRCQLCCKAHMGFYEEIYLGFFSDFPSFKRNKCKKPQTKPNPQTQCIKIVKASYYKKWHTSIFLWNSNPLFFCMAYDNLNLPRSVVLSPAGHCQFSLLSGAPLETNQP